MIPALVDNFEVRGTQRLRDLFLDQRLERHPFAHASLIVSSLTAGARDVESRRAGDTRHTYIGHGTVKNGGGGTGDSW